MCWCDCRGPTRRLLSMAWLRASHLLVGLVLQENSKLRIIKPRGGAAWKLVGLITRQTPLGSAGFKRLSLSAQLQKPFKTGYSGHLTGTWEAHAAACARLQLHARPSA